MPSQKDLKQATNGLSLLNNLQFKMPGLVVNESLQSITVDNTSPVLKINGKTTDLTHILSINPDHVLRIEYFDNPDIRYGNRQVINIILKPRDDGGYVIGNLFSALTTGNINANVGTSYHYKKSEFDLNYSTGWRDYNKRSRSSEESFVGGGKTINRYGYGVPCDFHYLSNVLSFGYTYMYDINTVLSANAGVAFENQNFDENSLNTESVGSNIKTYSRLIGRTVDYTSPNFDLYFKKQFDKSQFFEINAFASYSNGNFGRNISDTYDDMLMNESINTITQNTAWRAGVEFIYSKTFSRILSTNFGIREYYNSVNNSQIINTSRDESNIGQNRASAYAQFHGRIKKLNYSASIAYQNNHSNNCGYVVRASRLKTNVSLNYAASSHVTLNYLFMYDPSMPSSAQQSELIQAIDAISVRQGNHDLKPSEYFRNRIYARYNTKKFNTSLWASHSRTNAPIFYNYSYVDNETSPYFGKFMSRPINGNHNDLLNFEWYVTIERLFNHLTIWAKAGLDFNKANFIGYTYKKIIFMAQLTVLLIGKIGLCRPTTK